MPYDPKMIQPMREELSKNGVQELLTEKDVHKFMQDTQGGTALIVVNSVCGCAAGGARPGVVISLRSEIKPDHVATVFAGQDLEAVACVRSYIADFPPSSPSIALFRQGKVVHFVPRHMIEGRDPQSIGWDLVHAFEEHCAAPKSASG